MAHTRKNVNFVQTAGKKQTLSFILCGTKKCGPIKSLKDLGTKVEIHSILYDIGQP